MNCIVCRKKLATSGIARTHKEEVTSDGGINKACLEVTLHLGNAVR